MKVKEYKRLTKKERFGVISYNCANCERSNNDFCGKNVCNVTVGNRLAELEDKIENGTLIELPCKVGTKCYEIEKDCFNCEHHYYEQGKGHKCTREQQGNLFTVDFDKSCKYLIVSDVLKNTINIDKLKYFGTIAFVKRKDAEAKLKEIEGK